MDRTQLETNLADAYVWGYPTVDTHHVMSKQVLDPTSPEFKAVFNQFGHARTVATPSDHAIVAPNVDTPYSYLWMDLRAEPMVVTVPAFDEGRYVAMELFDLYTYVVGYVSPRTNGNAGGDFLIAGPSWEGSVPDGIKRTFRVPTQIAFALCRTQLFDPSDLANVHRIQDGYRARPLSEYAGTPTPPAPKEFPDIPAFDVCKDRQSPRFFLALSAMMEFMPPLDDEVELRNRFASAGVSAGLPFPESGELVDAARDAMASGQAKMFARAQTVRSSAEIFGSQEYLGDDYLSRAVGALLGIFGNAQEEYLGVGWQADANGNGFNGANRYEIRFEAGHMPPVAAFWSITVYTADKFLYANELNRYVINSPMVPSLAKDDDGGFTLYVQHDRPSDDKVGNWLPVPEGDFGLTLRCYQPKQPIIDNEWIAPPVVPVE
jgi:hypothetical protein